MYIYVYIYIVFFWGGVLEQLVVFTCLTSLWFGFIGFGAGNTQRLTHFLSPPSPCRGKVQPANALLNPKA